jgi:hypothetical protein
VVLHKRINERGFDNQNALEAYMSYKQERQQIMTDNPVTPPEIEAMIRGFLRQPRLLAEALRAGLQQEHFAHSQHELKYYAVFGAMCDLTEKYGAVTKSMLTHQLASIAVTTATIGSSMPLSPEDVLFLLGDDGRPGFIAEAFDSPALAEEENRAERAFCENILKRFLNSRLIKESLQGALNQTAVNSAPLDIDKLLEDYHKKSQRVQHVGAIIENAAAMPDFGTPIQLPPAPEPTNVPWIDTFLGGIRPGDLIGCLAPFGGGKTTMLISAAVRLAENYHLTEQNKIAVYIGFEDAANKTMPLCWSAASHIERKLFSQRETANFWDLFSTSANLKDYELKLPENQNPAVKLGERERWAIAQTWYNKNFLYIDYGAGSIMGSRKFSGPVELAEALHRIQEERKCEIGFVSIDYAAKMIDRMIEGESFAAAAKMQESMWRFLRLLPDQIRRYIADPFGATVLLAHQLAQGEIKKYPPSKYIHHHDSSMGKSFAENLHACFCLGVRDNDSHVSTINFSKIRASRPVAATGLVKISDDWVDVELVTDKYTVCRGSKKILSKGDVRPFGGGGEGFGAAPQKRAAAEYIDNFGDNLI